MKQFIITEDFPMNEIEFDERFRNEQACYDYLFKIAGLMALSVLMRKYRLLAE